MELSNKIEYLTIDNVSNFLSFIDKHWKKDHVFVKERKIFDYQHKTQNDTYSVITSINPEGNIESILGYIPSNESESSIWLAIWKSINTDGEGYRLLKRIISDKAPNFIGAIGISQDAIKLYKILGWTVDSTKHYFLNLNYPSLRKNKICDLKKKYTIIGSEKGINIDNNPICEPFKDTDYYIKRYFDHPSYEYKILDFSDLNLVIIGRIVTYLGYRIFRIVDVIGELNSKSFSNHLLCFMKDQEVDLIEMVMYDSLNPNVDMLVKSNEEVIPLYLSPFVNKNIQVDIGYTSKSNRVRFFIGDSDQDRPNVSNMN